MSEKNCIYFLPRELGHVGSCMMFGVCNQLGNKCAGFERHTAETRKALAEAIEIKKKGGVK